jgi:hypothetical protein
VIREIEALQKVIAEAWIVAVEIRYKKRCI